MSKYKRINIPFPALWGVLGALSAIAAILLVVVLVKLFAPFKFENETTPTGTRVVSERTPVIARTKDEAAEASIALLEYKRESIFYNILYESIPGYKPSYVEITETRKGKERAFVFDKFLTWEQGAFIRTENFSNVAIEGPGWFKTVDRNKEISYSRDGAFFFDAEGRLANRYGYLFPLITAPKNFSSDMKIDEKGTVFVYVPGYRAYRAIGTLDMHDFVDKTLVRMRPNGALASDGKNVYRLRDFQFRLYPGMLEMSAVVHKKEITALEKNYNDRKRFARFMTKDERLNLRKERAFIKTIAQLERLKGRRDYDQERRALHEKDVYERYARLINGEKSVMP